MKAKSLLIIFLGSFLITYTTIKCELVLDLTIKDLDTWHTIKDKENPFSTEVINGNKYKNKYYTNFLNAVNEYYKTETITFNIDDETLLQLFPKLNLEEIKNFVKEFKDKGSGYKDMQMCHCGNFEEQERTLIILLQVNDIVDKFPPEQNSKIVHTSLGSSRLITEYMLVDALIRFEYKDIIINAIDPSCIIQQNEKFIKNAINSFKTETLKFTENTNKSISLNYKAFAYEYIEQTELDPNLKSHSFWILDVGPGCSSTVEEKNTNEILTPDITSKINSYLFSINVRWTELIDFMTIYNLNESPYKIIVLNPLGIDSSKKEKNESPENLKDFAQEIVDSTEIIKPDQILNHIIKNEKNLRNMINPENSEILLTISLQCEANIDFKLITQLTKISDDTIIYEGSLDQNKLKTFIKKYSTEYDLTDFKNVKNHPSKENFLPQNISAIEEAIKKESSKLINKIAQLEQTKKRISEKLEHLSTTIEERGKMIEKLQKILNPSS